MKGFFKPGGIVAIVAAVLLALGMAIASAVLGGRATPVTNLIGLLLTPLQSGVERVSSRVESFFDYMENYEKLVEENRQLKVKIAQMEESVRLSEQANEENDRLRRLLELRQKKRDFEFESATIVARDTSDWASAFSISKGSAQGVEAGQCVINEEGFLVGVVTEVGTNWANVSTLIDTDMEAGAVIARTQQTAIAEGDFTLMQEKRLKLSYLPRDTDILIGDLVLTSGAGGIFPKDLVIGTIEEVYTEKNGISDYAVIVPSVDLDRLTQVFVIKSFDIAE